MAKASPKLISALRQTARRLENSETTYKWSHYAHCNCGNLVQTVTGLDPEAIQQRALLHEGDWGRQARERIAPLHPDFGDRPALDEGAWEAENIGTCRTTGLSMDMIFDELRAIGLESKDVNNLERLSDPKVLERLGERSGYFPHHVRENTIKYLYAWADLLEEQLPTPKPRKATAITSAPQPKNTPARRQKRPARRQKSLEPQLA